MHKCYHLIIYQSLEENPLSQVVYPLEINEYIRLDKANIHRNKALKKLIYTAMLHPRQTNTTS